MNFTKNIFADEQLSYIGSVNALSGIVGTFVYGSIAMRFGVKRAVILLFLPCFSYWMLIFFGNTYYHILIARCIMGCSGLLNSNLMRNALTDFNFSFNFENYYATGAQVEVRIFFFN